MKKSEKFISFLESLKDTSNAPLIDAVYEAFVLTEASVRGVPMPDVKAPERRRLQSGSKPLSQEEQDANSARFKREGSAAKQAGGRASGSMSQIVKYAMTAPLDVEKWMNETLKPAIKQGKMSMDQQFGTGSAKVGFGQRIKNMGKAMLGEGTEVDYDDDYEPEIDEDEDNGGFQSNKDAKRQAKQRRCALAESDDSMSMSGYKPDMEMQKLLGIFNTAGITFTIHDGMVQHEFIVDSAEINPDASDDLDTSIIVYGTRRNTTDKTGRETTDASMPLSRADAISAISKGYVDIDTREY